jgi:hypothetical protein
VTQKNIIILMSTAVIFGGLSASSALAAQFQVKTSPCKGFELAGSSWTPVASIPFKSGQSISTQDASGRTDIVYWKSGGKTYSVPTKCLASAEGGTESPPAGGASAGSSGSGQKSGYGTAGCGLGALILGDQPGIVQVVGVTLNGISANQTFGITSGTLNCGSGGAAPTAQAYIDANRESLATDIARGNGESLRGLVNLFGCKDVKHAGTALQKDYSRIFPDNRVNSAQIEKSIKTSLQGNCG